MGDTVIKVEGVAKKFCRRLRYSMYYGAQDVARGMLGMESRTEALRHGEFWAVDDVSFELKRGETMGLIGPNGSGKSTLLRLLNGIYPPDRGRIEIKGRVGALIAVGAGFHPLMTGRENIYLNGAIMGMSRSEIRKKFDSIVGFADIGEFLDAPVKTYSSGMYVRLGFAVAIHCEPDILLVDEVLAVGDARFQKRCFDKLYKLKDDGRAIVLVSHSVDVIKSFTTKVVLFGRGNKLYDGEPGEGVVRYMRLLFPERIENNWARPGSPAPAASSDLNAAGISDDGPYCLEISPESGNSGSFGAGGAWINKVRISGLEKPNVFHGGETLDIEVSVSWDSQHVNSLMRKDHYDKNLIVGITVENNKGVILTSLNTSRVESGEADIDPLESSSCEIRYRVEMPFLSEGDYFLSPAVALGRMEYFTPLKRHWNAVHLYCSPREKQVLGLMNWPVTIHKAGLGEGLLPLWNTESEDGK